MMETPNAAAVATIPPVSAHPTPIATPQPMRTRIIVAQNSAASFFNILNSPFPKIISSENIDDSYLSFIITKLHKCN